MGLRRKKGQVGEASLYISRTKACRKLQLSLVQFVRLCILKGVYPRKPKSYAKAQKGNTSIRTLYLRTDIKYLSQDPIIKKFREEKVHHRKLRTLHAQKEYKELIKLKKQKPTISVDHIIRERYPIFRRALEDLDDALSTCFLYRALPITKGPEAKLVSMSSRFTSEFLHFLIESRALRKAFITYQGYYYRAHVHGCRVTWMVPHPFPITESNQPHIRIMTSFVRFYATLLGFVNFKLFSSVGLIYPPVIPCRREAETHEGRFNVDDKVLAVRSLGLPIKKRPNPISRELSHNIEFLSHLNENALNLGEEEAKKSRAQMTLFQGIKFFLGRETNRESLTFVIRSAGGVVSWDRSLGHGATYEEQDPEIKYQIVDRPKIEVKHISRYYVQPQWVYDSFNAGFLIPVQQYFVGATLPAHLSPFEETYHQLYEPPEMVRLKAMQDRVHLVGDKAPLPTTEGAEGDEEAGPGDEDVDFYDDDEDEEEDQNEGEVDKEVEALSTIVQPQLKNFNTDMTTNNNQKKNSRWKKRRPRKSSVSEEEDGENPAVPEPAREEGGTPELLKSMCVSRGEPFVRRLDPEVKSKRGEMSRLAASFIHRKQRRLYDQARKKEQGRRTWAELFKTRRQAYEREMARRAQLEKATKQRDQLKKGARRRNVPETTETASL